MGTNVSVQFSPDKSGCPETLVPSKPCPDSVGKGRTRVCGEAYFSYVAVENPRRTQYRGKRCHLWMDTNLSQATYQYQLEVFDMPVIFLIFL